MTDTNGELLVRIAWLYYKDGLTQEGIATKFGLSRVKVSRLLTEARALGLVEINILRAAGLHLDRERELRTRFALHDVIVVPSSQVGEGLREALAHQAAIYLRRVLGKQMKVGLGMGRTLSCVPEFFTCPYSGGGTFTEMVGGTVRTRAGFDTYNISWKMAQLCGGEAEHVTSPVVVESPVVRDLLMRDPSIADVIKRAEKVDIALLSVGVVDEDCTLLQMGYLNPRDVKRLRTLGAVGDILGRFYDIHGHIVPHEINQRVIGIAVERLRDIPLVIVIAGGIHKAQAILGALRGRFVKVLITDHATAEAILTADKKKPGEGK
jgi:DNA-binding transcriptional regulator LsrR (DeoR family)